MTAPESASLLVQFIAAFLKSFTHTFKEILVHVLLGLGTIAYWYFGGIKSHFWEVVVPLVWVFCFEVGWHAVKAALLLSREAGIAKGTRTSLILSPEKKPFEFPEVPEKHFHRKIFGISVVVVCVCVLFSVLFGKVAYSFREPPTPPRTQLLQPISIFMDCEMILLPVRIPAQSLLHVLALNKKFMLSQHWGLFDIPNRTDQEQPWPPKDIMQKQKDNPGTVGYKCDISNHGQTDVLDVAIEMTFWYDKQKENDNIKYTPVVSPLDRGSHFIFYVFNDCPTFVESALPDTVTLTAAGDNAKRRVPLHLPHRSRIEQWMLFFPSKTQWVRQTSCE